MWSIQECFLSFCIVLLAFLTDASASLPPGANRTVTDEVELEFTIADYNGKGSPYKGSITIGVFGLAAPMTCMNFVAIAKGYRRGPELLTYKNSYLHRIVKDFVLQMGDITTKDGSGGTSIFGEKFNDEEQVLSHRAPGVVSMANRGKDTNGSQFFITMTKCRWMDGKHVAFGKVIKGYDTLAVLNELDTHPDTAWPLKQVEITHCGVGNLTKRYEMTEKQFDSVVDLK